MFSCYNVESFVVIFLIYSILSRYNAEIIVIIFLIYYILSPDNAAITLEGKGQIVLENIVLGSQGK